MSKAAGIPRQEAAYRYFEALGPDRSLKKVAAAWPAFGGYSNVAYWARTWKWWERAAEYDKREIKELQLKSAAQTKIIMNLMVEGLENAIKTVFVRDPEGNVLCRIPIKTWDDWIKVTRGWDYLTNATQRDPSELADIGSIHMAIVQLIQQAEAGSGRGGQGSGGNGSVVEGETVGQDVEDDKPLQDPHQRQADRKPQP